MLEPIVLKFGTSDYVGDMIAPVRAFRQMSEISFFSLLLFVTLHFSRVLRLNRRTDFFAILLTGYQSRVIAFLEK